MKKIWDENIVLDTRAVRSAFNGIVISRYYTIMLRAKAYYDTALAHAVLDLSVTPNYDDADEPLPWAYSSTRLSTDDAESHEVATRWAIAQIDRVAAQLRSRIPPADTRSDEEILAESSI